MADDRTTAPPGDLSIVIPVFNEERSIAPLVAEISAALPLHTFEIVFVDDGSNDGTLDAIAAARAADPRVRCVVLRRNQGKSAAYMAGFAAARCPVVATMDGDLQDDPADIPRLLARRAEGLDLVVGWKRTGKSGPGTFVLSRLSNVIVRLFTGLRLHDVNCPLRVLSRDLASRLLLTGDLHRYIPVLASRMGWRVGELPVTNRPRRYGRSKYTAGKYLAGASGLASLLLYARFGRRPMLLFLPLGAVAFLLGLVLDLWLAAGFFAGSRRIDDDLPTLLLGVMLIVIGTQFIALGLLAEIVIRNLQSLPGAARVDVDRELP